MRVELKGDIEFKRPKIRDDKTLTIERDVWDRLEKPAGKMGINRKVFAAKLLDQALERVKLVD